VSAPATAPPVGERSPALDGAARSRRLERVPVATLAWSTAIVGLGAGALGAAYPGWPTAALLVGACVVIAVVTGLAALLGLPRWLAPLMVVVAALVVSVVGMLGAPRLGPDAALATPAWRLLLDAVPHLLTTPPGTPARLDLIVPALLAVVAAQTVACVRAVARGPHRQVGLSPVLGSAVLYGCALVLSAGALDREGVVAGTLVVLTLLAWLRPSLPVVGVLLVVGFCATLVAALTFPPGRDVRTIVTPPTVAVAQPNLLPYLSRWADQTDIDLFTVSGEVPDRVALAVYPGFDGTSWSSGGSFALVGTHRSAQLPVGTLFAGYRMLVRPDAMPVDWLPSAGAVERVSLPDVLQDLTGGALLRIDGQEHPQPYTVTGRVSVADDQALPGAGVPGAGAAGPFLSVPDLPQSLQDWVDTNIRPFRGRYEQAAALETDLREGRRLDATAPGSTSIAAIADLVADPDADAPAETYASAFAVLARSVGLPTRLVVGARLSDHPGVDAISERTITSGEMSVWPEVYFSDVGWVPFDPVPGHDTPQQIEHAAVRDGGQPDGPAQLASPPSDQASPPQKPDPGERGGLLMFAEIAGGAVFLALLGALLAGWFTRRRMARRGAAGAYSLMEGGAVLAGLTLPPGPSAERVVQAIRGSTGQRVGALADQVAQRAQRQRFGPDGAGPDRQAWRLAAEVRRALRRATPWPRRLLWPVHPAGRRMAPLAGRDGPQRSIHRTLDSPVR